MKKKKKSFIKLFQILGLTLILTAGIAIIIFDIISNRTHLKSRTEQIRTNYNTLQKKIIKDKVMQVVDMVNYEKNKVENHTKKIIKFRVLEAYSIAENIYNMNKSSKSKEEIIKMITDALRPIRYQNGNGYFFATDLNGTEILFADKPELEGKNLINMQDRNGKFVIKDMISIAVESKEGFYEYEWTKPNAKKNNYKKLSYIKLFEPYDFYIGTGLYIKDIENELEKDLLIRISRIRFGSDGYIFINKLNGVALVSNGKVIDEGKKLWDVFNKNIDKTKKIFQLEYDAAIKPTGDYIYYKLIKLSDNTKEYDKTAFIMGIPQFNWLIGAGVYLDDVDNEITTIQEVLNSQIQRKIIFFILLIIVIIIIFLFIISKVSKRIEKDYEIFTTFFKNIDTENTELDLSLIKFEEFDSMAKNSNRIASELKKSEKRYRSLFDENPISLWEEDFSEVKELLNRVKEKGETVDLKYFDNNPNFLYECLKKIIVISFNKATLKLLKYSDNKTNIELDKIYNKNSYQTLKNGVIDIFNDKTAFSAETELICSDGTVISVMTNFQVLDNYKRTIISVIDITPRKRFENALKESEEYFRTIIEQSPIAMQVFDMNGILLNANQAWASLWNIEDINSVIGMYNIIDDPQVLELGLKEFIEKAFLGDKVKIPEIYYKPKVSGYDGRTRVVKFDAYPLKDSLGITKNVIVFNDDITDQKQAEENLKKIQNLESIGTLAGGIAHDFNNILTGLFGSISLAKMKLNKSHPSYEKLSNAEKSVDRATRLTKQLLTFAKGGAPIKENIGLTQIVKDTILFDLTGSNVKPVFDISENLWCMNADKGQMQQVFSNLTINANQAMENGGHLFISMKNIEISQKDKRDDKLKEDKYIKIIFRDEGIGIDNEKMKKIFDPYFTTKKTGNGLGLATVYSIIKRHDGIINISSEIGKGTTFTIYLPATTDSEESNSLTDKTNPTEQKKNSKRILLMDDEEMILTVTSEMLSLLGHKVETATNGEQAIEKYQKSIDEKNVFDCILMDLTIPGAMGGKDAVKKILEINKDAIVIVSSGYASDPIMGDYQSYGFKDVIAKPFTMELLEKKLNNI